MNRFSGTNGVMDPSEWGRVHLSEGSALPKRHFRSMEVLRT
jgi:hypothetical protein